MPQLSQRFQARRAVCGHRARSNLFVRFHGCSAPAPGAGWKSEPRFRQSRAFS